ncbi:tRNA pseudouridine(38-40) synthase TruA [Clostridium chauvoei]|uniref:tRNA pseudouridine synthase A n=2 Tax=Clostridium chauvoei TaxID=46867 RepID=A0A1U6IVC3_9CLOT|nr:tRNA pseudouridine(38-40) synthase TruA [Clostridium chauvoei]ATD53970.1 tRNA pseudouridine(38-40) synthase TruA [Clostridium chauvoei]ATD58231.1 tRNA pseudouridine(38-40) synthase TruA [Clostridium chauvoei]MBX7280616.1 tRNA pseudouridine(38-40) synthase TruA [Clostridium chauvoei]MBX7283056.1 tRNA pseudouridine(38-40) synthase TruA [Clostridium chauvoei]MBX7285414.1 tRNA pseudouridine(38-40) synthase TruA [Clostridium chauvoei]
MRNIKLVIEYDGTNYLGWQKQNNGVTIQGTIEEALKEVTKEEIDITGSSRTDSGVHAKGFVANFKTNSRIPAERFREALNVKLPNDIVILKSIEVEEGFHARYNAEGKTYSYTILNRDVPMAIGKDYFYQVKGNLDVEEMKKACTYFIGKHDFVAFKSSGSSVKTTVRTISDLHIENFDNYIKIFVTGDGFLYNMVRIIVGTLLLVGRGKIKAKDIERIIEDKLRDKAGMCVPAKGLVLEKVFYENQK